MPQKDEQNIKELLKDPEKLGVDLDRLNDDIYIDKTKLDVEWSKHNPAFDYWGLETAYAFADYLEIWEKVKTIRSEIIISIKGTAQEKEAKYRTDGRYLKAKREMIFAQAKHFYLEKVVLPEFYNRKTELQELLKMQLSDLYSEPQANKEGQDKLKKARSARAKSRIKTKKRGA